jgi:small-conductance mechanosensitive channel
VNGYVVAEADLAVQAKRDAEDKKKDFNILGDRKKFVDKLNAARKVTYGELAKMAHETMGLPSNFADLFFRRETREEDDDGEPLTLEQARASVAAAEAELEARQKRVRELEAEEAKAAEEAQKVAADKALLAELEKSAEEAQKKLAAHRAKLNP